jgi:hypothetical protein
MKCHIVLMDTGDFRCSVCFSAPGQREKCVGPVKSKPVESVVVGGPGTELKALLKDWLGIKSSPTCSCNAMARRMDTLGPDWCEGEGMASILDVMRAEHAKRRAAGKTILPWTDMGARQLVLLACRRARANG